MKKSLLLLFLSVSAFVIKAQPIDTLHENFDVACATATGSPIGWTIYNVITATSPSGAWHCGPADGRDTTPGMECTGVYGSSYHLDTSYLVTPLLYLGHYAGRVYLKFDSKTTNIYLGGRLALLRVVTPDSTLSIPGHDSDITGAILPVIGNGDSSDWVTHDIDITFLKTEGDLFLAFRYISTTTTGSTWYLDNINIDTTLVTLDALNVSKEMLPVKIIGGSTTSQITISYNASGEGSYHLILYDLMGQVVHNEILNAHAGTNSYTISGLNLHPGMYFVRMSDGNTAGTAKVMIQ